MKLQLNFINIKQTEFGSETRVHNGVLTINKQELTDYLLEDERIGKVELELARPGESCRILQIADIIEPRAKIDGGSDFPGAVGPICAVGTGETCVLRGMAVTVSDQSDAKDIAQAEDATGFLLDMSGPASEIHLYGSLNHVVVIPYPKEGVSRDGYKAALKISGLKAASYLAQAGSTLTPDSVEVFDLPAVKEERDFQNNGKKLPKVAYIFMAHCTSYPAIPGEPILYGDNIRLLLPTTIHPNEILDGAVVNPYDGVGTETYVLQNHPIITELFSRHGKDLDFAGVILTVSRVTEPERVRSAMMAANMAKWILGADGVILTKASSGATDIDTAQTAQACEDLGMKAVLIIFDR